MTMGRATVAGVALDASMAIGSLSAAGPAFADIAWMSNMYDEVGPLNVVTDGYFTRLPQDALCKPGLG